MSATPIRPGADRALAPVRTLPPAIAEAIERQQWRAWILRNLIQCVQLAQRDGVAQIEDADAAFDGLIELANSIHLALDPGSIVEAANEIAKENRGAAEDGAPAD
jgi:hypothetical protein